MCIRDSACGVHMPLVMGLHVVIIPNLDSLNEGVILKACLLYTSNFTCCGCWKSYGDPDAAQKHFDQLSKCTAVYLSLIHI